MGAHSSQKDVARKRRGAAKGVGGGGMGNMDF